MSDAARPAPKSVDALIDRYYETHPDGHFFDRATLKFFGERRSEMRLLKGTVTVKDISGKEHECYVISSVQRPGPPLKRRRKYHYFDASTYDDVIMP